MAESILQAADITKQFPGTLALENVHFDLRPGEIHAVMGENGAGKSTLMKILSGVYSADSGEIIFENQPVTLDTPHDALKLGIKIVHQELSLVPALSVAENIFAEKLPTNRLGMVNYKQLYQTAAHELATLEVSVDPRAQVEMLSIATQQMVEITKALSCICRVLILDEPTSALTDHEAETLLRFLRQLASSGVGIVYISHKLNEIFEVADRITVLRDGKYIGTRATSDVTEDDIIRMMVGRELGDMYPAKADTTAEALLEVRDLRQPESPHHNSFIIYRGEILGFAGLIGSGRSELARAIFGAEPIAEGEILLNGEVVKIDSPQGAIKLGLGYLPEDRRAGGLFLDMSVKLNVEAAVLDEVKSGFFVAPAKERALADQYVEQLNISTPTIDQDVRRLSGGNQQKTLVAKWLAIKPKILIVDEPTRGIDVGAKKEIHFLLRTLAENGVGVIMISSELPEILGMSDRILVMHEGAIVAEYDAADANEENIIRSASSPKGE